MSALQNHPQTKSAQGLLDDHWLRTGRQLTGAAALLERKFNPYHDPDDGRFTFKPGGGSLAPRQRNASSAGSSAALRGGTRRSGSARTASVGGALASQAAAFGNFPLPDFLNSKLQTGSNQTASRTVSAPNQDVRPTSRAAVIVDPVAKRQRDIGALAAKI